MTEGFDAQGQQHQYFTAKEIRGLFDWTEPSEGETRKLLASALGTDQESVASEHAKDDGSENGWLEAGPAVGLSNFSMLFKSGGGIKDSTHNREQNEQVAQMKAKLVSAEEKLRRETEGKKAHEQQSEATKASFEQITERISLSASAHAKAASKLKGKSDDFKKLRRLEAKAKDQLIEASARNDVAKDSHAKALKRAEEVEASAASSSEATDDARTRLLEAGEMLPDAIAGAERACSSVPGVGVILKTASSAMDALEGADIELLMVENKLLRVEARIAEAEARASPSDLEAAHAERRATDAERAQVLQRGNDEERRAGGAVAEVLQLISARRKESGVVAEETLQLWDSIWEASKRSRAQWRSAFAQSRSRALEAARAKSAVEKAARRAGETERLLIEAADEETLRRERREACEDEVGDLTTACEVAASEEASCRREREELRTALGSAHLAVLRSGAAAEEAASEQEALRSWCSKSNEVQHRVELATSSAVKFLRSEQYNSRQVEDAYQA
eukprot:CAMPEP_0183596894 /NCGR_PEP_ID=MMETSP0371-20130417/175935_1 /TAXON_ID=268820 /ORGANISM="Peridinium aciculiferum, Strain PAER-2" /LENGTH=508 /DNA_ID=CAMNT_0025808805 /DNA_START=8 /DNA_END=1530 /DNA_ORIENTATION=-